jgi:hypothetical protein
MPIHRIAMELVLFDAENQSVHILFSSR